jgi:hypothetical protein
MIFVPSWDLRDAHQMHRSLGKNCGNMNLVANFLHRIAPRRERHTCYLNLVSGLGITKEVTADTLLLRIFLSCLRVHVHGAPDTKAGGLSIELVAISRGCNRV